MRKHRYTFDAHRGLTVRTNRHIANERDAIQLAVKFGIENIDRRQMCGGTVVPERP